jgi:S1-C subfamily serine protease
VVSPRNRYASALTQRLYSLDNLIKGGIDASLAEDIVRRKNSIELQRLALYDLATREGYLNTQRYFDELEAINSSDISLRDELGDETYDSYLYNSKQNNRIRISSVMLGSAAEQAGIKKGDVVLSYDNTRMFNWQELKDATAEGQLGEYVSISIYRSGEIFSFSVPRGPLGIQLGATRLAP